MSQNTPDSQHDIETDAPAAEKKKSTATGVSLAPASTAVVAQTTQATAVASAEPAVETIDGDSEAPAEDRRKEDRGAGSGAERRQNVVDRRTGLNRRVLDIGSPTGLERRRGPGRRRTDDRRSAEEGEMTDEQFEFVMAIDTYKRLNKRPFPSWTEVLEVVKQLGYRKVAASSIRLPNNNGRAEQE